MLDQGDQSTYPSESNQILLQKLLDNYSEPGEEQQNEQAESASASSKDHSEHGRDTQSPVTITGHNIVKLLNGIGQQPCSCSDCQKQLPKNVIEQAHTSSVDGSTPATPMNDFNIDLVTNVVKTIQQNKHHDEVEYVEDGTIKRGRRSKYCTPDEKRQVAAYAELHGATAAAKKFDIPPAVAAYYHRKLRFTITGKDCRFTPLAQLQSPRKPTSFEQDDVTEELEDDSGSPATPKINTADLFNSGGNSASRSNYAPVLRGRGRGRPKLIGDDLDAELVDYMVSVKQRVPRGHLTATYALEVARGYILNKKPDILVENGGHISLKLTWAMKLVSRTNDRFRELYGNNNPEGGNAESKDGVKDSVNEMLANLGHSSDHRGMPGSTPEITNVRALDLNNFAFDQPIDNAGGCSGPGEFMNMTDPDNYNSVKMESSFNEVPTQSM